MPPKSPSTIYQIAERVGTTPGTVSSVLSGNAVKRRISEKLSERVLKAAAELDYVPNLMARSVRRQSTGMIGVLFKDFHLGWRQHALDGIQQVLYGADLLPILVNDNWDPGTEARLLRYFVQLNLDGVLAIPDQDSDAGGYRQIVDRGIPLVFFGDRLTAVPEASTAVWSSGDAIAALVAFLSRHGFDRFGYVGTRRAYAPRERLRAFVRATREAGTPADRGDIFWLPNVPDWRERLNERVREMVAADRPLPRVMITQNDVLALGLIDACRQQGLDIPGDLSVVGLEGLYFTEQLGLGVASMLEPTQRVGKEAAELLLRQAAGGEPPPEYRTIEQLSLRLGTTLRLPASADVQSEPSGFVQLNPDGSVDTSS